MTLSFENPRVDILRHMDKLVREFFHCNLMCHHLPKSSYLLKMDRSNINHYQIQHSIIYESLMQPYFKSAKYFLFTYSKFGIEYP